MDIADIQHLRIPLRLGDRPARDIFGDYPRLWRGNPAKVSVALLDGGTPVDVSGLAEITVEVCSSQTSTSSPLMIKTVAAANFGSPTASTWADGTAQHALFTFTGDETNLTISGAYQEFWLVIHGLRVSGGRTVFAVGSLIVEEDNAGNAGSPPINAPDYYTAIETDALLAARALLTDPRFTDSREWTADTVTQVDAEAGTATDRKAWTVQRVWQAIAAWWAGSAMKTKLDGIAAGATANQTDAHLLNRANHTGTQSASTISDFKSAVIASAGSFAVTSVDGKTGNVDLSDDYDPAGSAQAALDAALLASPPGARTPTAHASTHATGGSDPVTAADADPAGPSLAAAFAGKAAARTYRGYWNPVTNSPALADGTGTLGDYYRVRGVTNVAFPVDLGSGEKTFTGRQMVIYDGAEWQPILSAQAVDAQRARVDTLDSLFLLDNVIGDWGSSVPPSLWGDLTHQSYADGIARGFPTNNGVVRTNGSSAWIGQLWFETGADSTDQTVWYRHRKPAADEWTPWRRLQNQRVIADFVRAIGTGGLSLQDSTGAEHALLTSTGLRIRPRVVSASITAELDGLYHGVATATYTDPTPAEGRGYLVRVINGTATVGGTAYAAEGTVIFREFHSGAWRNRVLFGGADAAAVRGNIGAGNVDFVLGFYEKPEDDDEDYILISRAIRIPSGASGVAFSRVAANAETTFLVRKNGSNIGTVVFAAAATTGTVSITSATDFAAGDRLELIAPATADDDLENLQVTLKGVLL